jgi:hypothetical protein
MQFTSKHLSGSADGGLVLRDKRHHSPPQLCVLKLSLRALVLDVHAALMLQVRP